MFTLRTLPIAVLALLGAGSSCASGPPRKNEVIVLGTIHGDHRTSQGYSLEVLEAIVRAIDPDYVLAEIPPDRLGAAQEQFHSTGTIVEPRVRVFPEYTDVIFPLSATLDFLIVPCAAWTKSMADDRATKLAAWKVERAAETAEVDAAQARCEAKLAEEGLDDDPFGVNSARYDALTREGLEPYDRLFNQDLGPGGWTNINRAHYALIAAALDAHRGEGKRFLVTYGAGHRYWFLDALRERDDIELRALEDFVRRDAAGRIVARRP
jgi:hypothetical protein